LLHKSVSFSHKRFLSVAPQSQNPANVVQSCTNVLLEQPRRSNSTYTNGTVLDQDEQQLLDAIHAHPKKRDLVMNLLRQMNQSSLMTDIATNINSSIYPQQNADSPSSFDFFADSNNMERDD
jgi:hypothetical protein